MAWHQDEYAEGTIARRKPVVCALLFRSKNEKRCRFTRIERQEIVPKIVQDIGVSRMVYHQGRTKEQEVHAEFLACSQDFCARRDQVLIVERRDGIDCLDQYVRYERAVLRQLFGLINKFNHSAKKIPELPWSYRAGHRRYQLIWTSAHGREGGIQKSLKPL